MNIKEILVSTVEIVKLLAILAAFGAFALSMRQKEFDRFSLIKPLFEVEELDNKNDDSKLKLRLLNYGGLVYFIGCEDNKTSKEKLRKTPRKYSSLSKEKSTEFLFENNMNKNDRFIFYYRDVDTNLYELEIVYRKNPNTNTNGFYIIPAPSVYRSDLFVTMSQKHLDKIVNAIFPKDWYSKHENLKCRFKDKCSLNKLNEIDKYLLVKYNN